MTRSKKRKKNPENSGSNNFDKDEKLKFHLTEPFKKELENSTDSVKINIIKTLRRIKEQGGFPPVHQLKKLIVYKNKRILYFRAGGDIRITVFKKGANIYFLSIESHDTLKRAPKRVIRFIPKD